MILYKCIHDSLTKLCKDFAADNLWAATIYDFDAFAENNKLPAGDLIGLQGYTLDADTDLVTVKCMIGIATEVDENLFRLNDMAGKLFQHMAPNEKFDLYDVDASNAVVGKLTIGSGTSISPVYRAQLKPLKLLSFTAFSSKTLSQ